MSQFTLFPGKSDAAQAARRGSQEGGPAAPSPLTVEGGSTNPGGRRDPAPISDFDLACREMDLTGHAVTKGIQAVRWARWLEKRRAREVG